MNYTITDAKTQHIPAMEAIERLCFSSPWTEQTLSRMVDDSACIFLAAGLDSGGTIGYVSAVTVLDEGYIGNVAVHPDYRRRGVADALITELKRRCAGALSFLTLEVRAGNAAAVALYKKHGFKTVGERKDYYDKPRENALLMTYFFREETEEC